MTTKEIFDKYNDEYLNFNRVKDKTSKRADLHAFNLLDKLFPTDWGMISCAEHDEFWLGIRSEEIEKLTEEQIIELVRCGIRYDNSTDSLCMFA